ncbi:hypothetical protein C8R47DRAFT_1210178 [Mycena vitilis]|nr:hypothetical protein C8R47DRAFT_1210178 [Mycena vitilis]
MNRDSVNDTKRSYNLTSFTLLRTALNTPLRRLGNESGPPTTEKQMNAPQWSGRSASDGGTRKVAFAALLFVELFLNDEIFPVYFVPHPPSISSTTPQCPRHTRIPAPRDIRCPGKQRTAPSLACPASPSRASTTPSIPTLLGILRAPPELAKACAPWCYPACAHDAELMRLLGLGHTKSPNADVLMALCTASLYDNPHCALFADPALTRLASSLSAAPRCAMRCPLRGRNTDFIKWRRDAFSCRYRSLLLSLRRDIDLEWERHAAAAHAQPPSLLIFLVPLSLVFPRRHPILPAALFLHAAAPMRDSFRPGGTSVRCRWSWRRAWPVERTGGDGPERAVGC